MKAVATTTKGSRKALFYMVLRAGLGLTTREFVISTLISVCPNLCPIHEDDMTDATAAATLLARKKKTRSGHRASTTRLVNQAATAIEAEDIDTDQLLLTRQMLVEKVETLKVLDGEMAELVPEEELEEEIQRADEYKERVYGVLAKLNKALGPITAPLPTVVARTEPSPTVRRPLPVAETSPPVTEPRTVPTEMHPTLVSTTPTTARVKLPKISLPHFRGNLMRWPAFWDSFNSAVHTNDQLSEIDKFNYLRSLLEGVAYDAIAGLALSASNYGEAVEILKKRFGNRQLIISKHMESLLGVNAVTSDSHLRDLRRLYDQAEANIRSLKALGVEPESYGTMLSSVLLNKLPPDIRLIVSRKVSTDDLHMGSLLETFEQELIARERAATLFCKLHIVYTIKVDFLPRPLSPMPQDRQFVPSVSKLIPQRIVVLCLT